jgi:glycosyltransferase involved in cell wall biosynthesis
MAQDAYNITLAMRRRGIEADLVVTNREYQGDVPTWENGDTPVWVKTVKVPKRRVLRDLVLVGKLGRLFPKYDLTFCHYPSSLQAYVTNATYVPYDSGAIRYLPFSKNPLPPYRKHFLWTNALLKLLKRSYRKAPVILFTNPDTLPIFREADLDARFVPFAIDAERYSPKGDSHRESLVFFMPSRHHWIEKSNDKAIKAFADFHKRFGGQMVLVNWGTDLEKSKEVVRKLGIESSVSYLEPMPKAELIEQYRNSDVVLDQFTLGSWGTATPEAMACGKPVIMYYNSAVVKDCFGSLPPILNSFSIGDIEKNMEECLSRDFRRTVGQKSREWIKKTHDPDLVVDIHLDVAEQVINR